MTAPGTTASFDAAIVVDWSAASSPGPARPTKDRVWLAWGAASDLPAARPPPEYFRTRTACEARLRELLDDELSDARTLVGFDFPIGYPVPASGVPVLPIGRALCAHLAMLTRDDPDGLNNRFEVAAELNRRIQAQTEAPAGPFWGHPPGRAYTDLPFRRSIHTGVPEWRACEAALRSRSLHPQSPWKLSGAGSVGSQSLLGLPAVHRLLEQLGDRGQLWPFDNPTTPRTDVVVVAEVWPTLAGDAIERVHHPIKDARQVAALREQFLTGVDLTVPEATRAEGWILGTPLTTSQV